MHSQVQQYNTTQYGSGNFFCKGADSFHFFISAVIGGSFADQEGWQSFDNASLPTRK